MTIVDIGAWARADFLLVIDLEATTSEGRRVFPATEMETIEIGAVLVRASTLEPEDEFQSFVRPFLHPILLPFCSELTGIPQHVVDDAPTFPEAFAEMKRRLVESRDGTVVWGSWGRFDAEQFRQDCDLHQIAYEMPPYLDLKAALSSAQGWRRKYGMAKALTRCGLELKGSHHRGIDDARNVARMLPWIVGGRRAPWDS
jgi:inhibitor of KinA sporulation pathway (predicted exonuclease)